MPAARCQRLPPTCRRRRSIQPLVVCRSACPPFVTRSAPLRELIAPIRRYYCCCHYRRATTPRSAIVAGFEALRQADTPGAALMLRGTPVISPRAPADDLYFHRSAPCRRERENGKRV